MGATFACPECGEEVKPRGLGPGLQVRCSRCATLVEVPYFPRRVTHRPKKRARRLAWAGGGAALVAAVLLTAEVARRVKSFGLSARDGAASSRRVPCRAEVEAQLDAIGTSEAADPGDALGRYRVLRAQADSDPALIDLADRIRELMDRARRRVAESDLIVARGMITIDPNRAIASCERATHTAQDLPPGEGRLLLEEARAIASEVAKQSGVILPPVRGRFTQGTSRSYDRDLHAPLAEALRGHDYAPLTATSPFRSLWDELAPFRMTVDVIEEHGEDYLGSPNRTSRIEAKLILSRAGSTLWQVSLAARTQVPVPHLRAFEAKALTLGPRRSLAAEQRLYKVALDALHERIFLKLRGLPDRPESAPMPGPVVPPTGELAGHGGRHADDPSPTVPVRSGPGLH